MKANKKGKKEKEEPPLPAAAAAAPKGRKKPAVDDVSQASPAVADAQKPRTWTGKFPATMLNEYCQKNKRPKPLFEQQSQSKDGFLWRVTVYGPTDAKPGKEEPSRIFVATVRFEDSQEARHAAAVVALHHYRSNLSLIQVLPHEYRDLWRLLDNELKAKKQAEKAAVDALPPPVETKPEKKERLPLVVMTDEARRMIETAVKQPAGEGREESEDVGVPEGPEYDSLAYALVEQGFERDDAEAALSSANFANAASRLTTAIEWLCLNVPESRLPSHYGPATATVTLMPMRKENPVAITRSPLELLMSLSRGSSSENETTLKAAYLDLLGQPTVSAVSDVSDSNGVGEELEALGAIFGDDFKRTSPTQIDLALSIDGIDAPCFLRIYLLDYPKQVPLFLLESSAMSPQARVELIRQIGLEAHKRLGSPLLFEVVTWVQSSAAGLAAAATTAATNANRSTCRLPTPASTSTLSANSNSTPAGRSHSRNKGPSGEALRKPAEIFALSASLKRDLEAKGIDPAWQKFQTARERLPTVQHGDVLRAVVLAKPVVVISGATGCGKSTQLPQILLDSEIKAGRGGSCSVICTQPRRMAAIGVAQRVANERCERLGDVVGYQVRLDSKSSVRTRLLYCTTGILLRRFISDPNLVGVSHVIVDEVHERSLEIDFLLLLLRRLLSGSRPDLKVVLMSASLDAAQFAAYFNKAPVFEIPGSLFAVREYYSEDITRMLRYESPTSGSDDEEEGDMAPIDFSLLERLVLHVAREAKGHGILVFLPGLGEILQLCERLRGSERSMGLVLLPLHSSIAIAEQNRVFEHVSATQVKVVVSTNIAETSVTIDDIVAVIDAGRMNQLQYDSASRMPVLKEIWVSQANATQRRGRAGRVREGTCYRLYSKQRHHSFPTRELPEMLRTPLEQVCLQVKLMKLGKVAQVFNDALEPPQTVAVTSSVETLVAYGALHRETEDLTPLGHHLANLPVSIYIGKLILFGAIFHCVDTALTIAACLSVRSPFLSPIEKRKEARQAQAVFAVPFSDHLTLVNAYNKWMDSTDENQFCNAKFLSRGALRDIRDAKRQFAELLSDIGFIRQGISVRRLEAVRRGDGVLELSGASMNSYSTNSRIIKAVLTAALYPNVARIIFPEVQYKQMLAGSIPITVLPHELKFVLKSGEAFFIHPKSVNNNTAAFEYPFLVYHEKIKTSRSFLVDTTMSSPLALLLFGGEISIDTDKQQIAVDNWLQFAAPARVAVLARSIRQRLEDLLNQKIANPLFDVSSHALIDATVRLLATDGVVHDKPQF